MLQPRVDAESYFTEEFTGSVFCETFSLDRLRTTRVVPQEIRPPCRVTEQMNTLALDHEMLHVANYQAQFGSAIIKTASALNCEVAEQIAEVFAKLELGIRMFIFYSRVMEIDNNGDRDRGFKLLQEMWNVASSS